MAYDKMYCMYGGTYKHGQLDQVGTMKCTTSCTYRMRAKLAVKSFQIGSLALYQDRDVLNTTIPFLAVVTLVRIKQNEERG